MPRVFYLILFLILTLIPFPILWITQTVFNTANTAVSTNAATGSSNHHSHYYSHSPGWFFFYSGNSGRGGWLNRTYRTSGGNSSGGLFGSSRSYTGGSSSFSGGGFGSSGK